jgi:hypothetical protein
MSTRCVRFALVLAGLIAALGWLPAPSAAADIDFGVRGGFYDDADAGFVGAELLMEVYPRWFIDPNVEYAFVDDGSLWTLNADVHYDFPVTIPFAVWAGAGPAVIHRSTDAPRGCRRCSGKDDTDLGLNLLGGIGFRRGAVRPYLQGKVVLSGDTEAVFAVGLRFH